MTVTTLHAPTPAAPPKRGRWWWYLGIALLVTAAVGVVVLIAGAQTSRGGWLDPENPGPIGAEALASVIDSHGAEVRIVRTGRALADADIDANTTVVVGTMFRTPRGWGSDLLSAVRDARRLVLIAPSSTQLGSLELPVGTTDGTGTRETVPARCSAPSLSPGDTVSVGEEGFHPFESGSATECFVDGDASQLVVLPSAPDRPETVVMTGTMLRNDEITRVDNAGVAIRTLAPTHRVVWFQPTAIDDAYGGDDTTDDIPDAIAPLVLLAGFGLLAAMLWRGRRFGPLVTEPLPVVVKSDETTRSRGRLYHRSRAIDRSAAALRTHTLQKISLTVGLPYDPRSGGRVDALVDAAAAASGWDPARVHPLLAGPLPVDDDGLVRFARALSDLEKEVRFTP